jgi:hypothetical protein
LTTMYSNDESNLSIIIRIKKQQLSQQSCTLVCDLNDITLLI